MLLLQIPDAGRHEKQKKLQAGKKCSFGLTLALRMSSASTGAVPQPSLSPTANDRTDGHLMNLILTCVE